ncbi:ERF family protein [Micromonospora haikouensis]|uniref:ERF family protein n=1 Tax=Micromonospora haikouensis TaxID=686309 RepID=UPI003D7543F9
MSLRERAEAAEAPPATDWPAPTTPGTADRPADTGRAEPADELPDIEYTGAIVDVDQVPVHVGWARVMADVQSVGKGDQYDPARSGGRGGKYNYRGVDRVLNAVGPALRRHGVMVIPVRTEPTYRDVTTSGGAKMRECTVTVTYEIRGPKGDVMPAQSCGEAFDSGDKATTKASTVAYRNLLITALSIPTRDPRLDAEASNHERGAGPRPADYRDEIADPRTSLGRLKQMSGELQQHNLLGAVVMNEVGEQEQLGTMYSRVVRQRRAEAGE